MAATKTKRPIQQCVYCGAVNEITRDHIPPKNIFPKARPGNLITVPCCRSCNSGFSIDDEWFRIIIACDPLSAEHLQSQKLWPTVLRQLHQETGAMAVPELLRLSFGESRPDNIDDRIQLAELRLARVLMRIVKGLYFAENGVPLPISWEVKICVTSDCAPGGEVANVAESIAGTTGCKGRSIGDGVFQYHVVDWPEKVVGMVWILRFFESIHFVCTTGPKK